MLIKIQNIEEECGQLEDDCENLKQRINRLLNEAEKDKEEGCIVIKDEPLKDDPTDSSHPTTMANVADTSNLKGAVKKLFE